MQQRISNVESQINQVQVHIGLSDSRMQEATAEFRAMIERQFAEERNGIEVIVQQAQQEFQKIRADVGQAQTNTRHCTKKSRMGWTASRRR